MARRTRGWLLGFALVGLAASAAATYTHYQLLRHPGYLSFCDISQTVSCTQVYASRYGSVAGVPVALLGLIWFTLVTGLAAAARRGPAAFRENAGSYLFVLATIGLAVILYLGYTSFFVLKTLCLLCLTTYVGVLGVFVISGAAATQPMRTLPGRLAADLRTLAGAPRALVLAVLFLAAAGASVVWFPRESVAAPAAGATAQDTPPVTDAQRSEFARWYAQQPHVNLPVPRDGAKVLIVKFSDYQCPACAQAYLMYRDLFARYQTTNPGAVRLVEMDFPLNPGCNAAVPRIVHTASCEAAVAVRLAREHGKGAAMEEWLYTNQAMESPASVKQAAREIGGVTDFDARYPSVVAAVKTDAALGALNNVHSTPTFFINGTMLAGTLPPQFFQQAIEIELQKASQASK